MKIYIEHNGEFYDYYNTPFKYDITQYAYMKPTANRNFEIGSRVYFDGIGWTETLSGGDCKECVRSGMACNDIICLYPDKHFKKLNTVETSSFYGTMPIPENWTPNIEEKEVEKFYVYNTKTGQTRVSHISESEAREEAERLSRKQPEDTFQILKVIAECTADVKIKWSDKKC